MLDLIDNCARGTNTMRLACLVIAIAAVTVPLLARQEGGNVQNALKAGGSTYFTTKMQNLKERLNLSDEQVAKLKPIAEQEVGYFEEIHGNPVLSRKEKVKRLEEIVRNSDSQMKPMLSAEQWQKLQTMRKEQKSELMKFAEQSKTGAKQ